MKKVVKSIVCVLVVLAMTMSLASCSSSTKMTEENVKNTVKIVETALKEFDIETLEKYVASPTLSYIISFAKNHEQFVTLGKAIFADLEMEVESVDLDAKTVTIKVGNTKIESIAADFATRLKKNYSTFQLVGLLKDEAFLNSSLAELVGGINNSSEPVTKSVTLKVEKGDDNLTLAFSDEVEDAVSGGALKAIKAIYS